MTDTAMRFDFGPEFDANAAALKLAAAHEALEAAKAEARHAARGMAEHGRSEVEIAGRLGVTRRTVRRWIGRERP